MYVDQYRVLFGLGSLPDSSSFGRLRGCGMGDFPCDVFTLGRGEGEVVLSAS